MRNRNMKNDKVVRAIALALSSVLASGAVMPAMQAYAEGNDVVVETVEETPEMVEVTEEAAQVEVVEESVLEVTEATMNAEELDEAFEKAETELNEAIVSEVVADFVAIPALTIDGSIVSEETKAIFSEIAAKEDIIEAKDEIAKGEEEVKDALAENFTTDDDDNTTANGSAEALEAANQAKDDAEAALDTAEEELNKADAATSSAQAATSVDAASTAAGEAVEAVADANKAVEDAQTAYDEAKAAYDKAVEAAEAAEKAANEAIESGAENAKDALDAATKAAEAAENLAKDMESKKNDLADKLANSKKALGEAKRKLSDATVDVGFAAFNAGVDEFALGLAGIALRDAKSAVDHMEKQVDQKETALEKAEINKNDKQSIVDELNEAKNQLENDIEEAEKAIEQSTDDVSTAKEALATAKLVLEQLNTTLEELEGKKSAAQGVFDKAEAAYIADENTSIVYQESIIETNYKLIATAGVSDEEKAAAEEAIKTATNEIIKISISSEVEGISSVEVIEDSNGKEYFQGTNSDGSVSYYEAVKNDDGTIDIFECDRNVTNKERVSEEKTVTELKGQEGVDYDLVETKSTTKQAVSGEFIQYYEIDYSFWVDDLIRIYNTYGQDVKYYVVEGDKVIKVQRGNGWNDWFGFYYSDGTKLDKGTKISIYKPGSDIINNTEYSYVIKEYSINSTDEVERDSLSGEEGVDYKILEVVQEYQPYAAAEYKYSYVQTETVPGKTFETTKDSSKLTIGEKVTIVENGVAKEVIVARENGNGKAPKGYWTTETVWVDDYTKPIYGWGRKGWVITGYEKKEETREKFVKFGKTVTIQGTEEPSTKNSDPIECDKDTYDKLVVGEGGIVSKEATKVKDEVPETKEVVKVAYYNTTEASVSYTRTDDDSDADYASFSKAYNDAKVALEAAEDAIGEYNTAKLNVDKAAGDLKTAEDNLKAAENRKAELEKQYEKDYVGKDVPNIIYIWGIIPFQIGTKHIDSTLEKAESELEAANKAYVDANNSYDKAVKDLKDKKDKLDKAQTSYNDASKKLEASRDAFSGAVEKRNAASKEVSRLERTVIGINAQYEATVKAHGYATFLAGQTKIAEKKAQEALNAVNALKGQSSVSAKELAAAEEALKVAEKNLEDAKAAEDAAKDAADKAQKAYEEALGKYTELLAKEEAEKKAAEEAARKAAEEATRKAAEEEAARIAREAVSGNDDAANGTTEILIGGTTIAISPAAQDDSLAQTVANAVRRVSITTAQAGDEAAVEEAAEDGEAEETVAPAVATIADNDVPEAAKDTVTIGDNETALSATIPVEEKMSWWWLILVIVAGGTGLEMYRRHQAKKKAAEVKND